MPAHSQAPGQNQMPQNPSQQRPGPNMPQKPAQGQPSQNQFSYNPQLAIFIFEKSKNAESWDDVEPEEQHIPLPDLKNQLNKYRRKRGNVKASLDEISSATIRRLINELVEVENRKLWDLNKALQWKIASVETEWRQVNKLKRQIKRVSVLLETEASRYTESQTVRPPTAGPQGVQDPNKPKPAGGPGMGQMNAQAQNMAQQQRAAQQHAFSAAQGQQFDAQLPPPPPPAGSMHANQAGHHHQHHGNMHPKPPGHQNTNGGPPPPPPPPPGHPGHPQNTGMPPPPPPPPGGVRPQHDQMRGAFPRHANVPVMKHGHPNIEILDYSTSESESGTDSSRSGHFHVRNVEQGEYTYVDKREKKDRHGKHNSSKKKTSTKHRSRSRDSHTKRGNDGHHHRRHKHSDEEYFSSSNNSDYSMASSRRSHGGRHREQQRGRARSGERPGRSTPEHGRYSKPDTRSHRRSHDRYRHNSPHGSDIGSFHSSSTHSGEGGDWDTRRRSTRQDRTRPYPQQSHRRHSPSAHDFDDYPHARFNTRPRSRDITVEDPPFPSRPMPARHTTSTHIPPVNPFNSPRYQADPTYPSDPTARFQPGLRRSNTFDQYPRYASERPAEREQISVKELGEALDLLQTIKEKTRTVPLHRGYSARDSGVGFGVRDEDEWANRYPSARGEAAYRGGGGGGGFGRHY